MNPPSVHVDPAEKNRYNNSCIPSRICFIVKLVRSMKETIGSYPWRGPVVCLLYKSFIVDNCPYIYINKLKIQVQKHNM